MKTHPVVGEQSVGGVCGRIVLNDHDVDPVVFQLFDHGVEFVHGQLRGMVVVDILLVVVVGRSFLVFTKGRRPHHQDVPGAL